MTSAVRLAARVVLGCFAVAAVGLSFAIGVTFWSVSLAGQADSTVYTVLALSVLATGFKVFVPAFVAAAKISGRDARALWVLFAVAFAFDVLSGLGYSGMIRGAASGAERDANRARAEVSAELKDLQAQLKRLAEPRASIEKIESEIKVADAQAGDCSPRSGRQHKDACTLPVKLRGDLGDARAYHDLHVRVDALRKRAAELGAEREADPQAAAVVRALSFIRLDVSEETAGMLWGVVLLLLIELGSTVAVAETLRSRPEGPEEFLPRPVAAVSGSAGTLAPSGQNRPQRPAKAGRVDLLTALRSVREGSLTVPGCIVSPAGELTVSQSSLAETLGTSKANINRAIKTLAGSGAILATAGRNGTHIKFTNPPLSVVSAGARPGTVTHA